MFYPGKVPVRALTNVSITIEQGEFTCLVGPSGSGKTTLLNLLGALDQPTSGHVQVEGRTLASLHRNELAELRRDRIGFVFQAYNLVPSLTAFENAEFVLNLQRIPSSIRQKRVMDLMRQLGLEGLEHRYPAELSGGQQQRVAVARAMATNPAVILADEPTANLDSKTSTELLRMMQQINENLGTTFVFSTHDPLVMDHAKRIVHLVDGQIAQDERPAGRQTTNRAPGLALSNVSVPS